VVGLATLDGYGFVDWVGVAHCDLVVNCVSSSSATQPTSVGVCFVTSPFVGDDKLGAYWRVDRAWHCDDLVAFYLVIFIIYGCVDRLGGIV